jgi:hypothetical protein
MFYLSNNKTAYNSYFKWKRHVSFHNIKSSFNVFCSMCVKLQLEAQISQIDRKIMHNIGEQWRRDKNCKSVKVKKIQVFDFEKKR